MVWSQGSYHIGSFSSRRGLEVSWLGTQDSLDDTSHYSTVLQRLVTLHQPLQHLLNDRNKNNKKFSSHGGSHMFAVYQTGCAKILSGPWSPPYVIWLKGGCWKTSSLRTGSTHSYQIISFIYRSVYYEFPSQLVDPINHIIVSSNSEVQDEGSYQVPRVLVILIMSCSV